MEYALSVDSISLLLLTITNKVCTCIHVCVYGIDTECGFYIYLFPVINCQSKFKKVMIITLHLLIDKIANIV